MVVQGTPLVREDRMGTNCSGDKFHFRSGGPAAPVMKHQQSSAGTGLVNLPE